MRRSTPMMKRRDLLVAHFKNLIADARRRQGPLLAGGTEVPPLPHSCWRPAMVRGAFVGGGKFEQPLVVPHSSQQRDADWVTAADEPGGHRHLRQAGCRAFLARARARIRNARGRLRACAAARGWPDTAWRRASADPAGRRRSAGTFRALPMNRRVASSSAAPVGAGASAPSRRRALTGASFPDASRS